MTRRKTTRSSSSSSNEGEAFERIPFDLIVEIHLRLPVKSVARFRCISKLWYSTFLGSNFTDSFFTISSSRPKLLFTCLKDGETFFFTSPQPQDRSSPLSANIHMSFPVNCPTNISRPVRGLVCGLNQRNSKGRTVTVPLICNPSTGQSLALPRVETRRRGVISYFGYDPIDKSFKVLCMTVSNIELNGSKEHQVLTLGTGKELSWMMIKCDVTHDPAVVEVRNGFSLYDGICINGVVYYLAYVHASYDDGSPDIVSFDIKSEKFNYIKKADGGMIMDWRGNLESTLVNYKDKLAKLEPNIVNGVYNGIQLWVLENAEKHEWSSCIYILPPPWKNIFEETKFCFVGTTGKGEIVLSPNTISDSFYFIYYNPERDTITKVGIQGMEAFKGHKAYTFLDHTENVTLFSQGLWIMGS